MLLRSSSSISDKALGKATFLMNITFAYHFHNIVADSEKILNKIQKAIPNLGFVADRMPYKEDIL